MLNRESKEATVIPMKDVSGPQPQSGGKPALSPPAAPTEVQDLGKRMLLGHEVEGKRYTFPPVMPPPQPKEAPMPAEERRGAAVKADPPPPQTLEVWTATKLQIPLVSRTVGVLGKQTTMCRKISPGEPPAAAFKIPPEYKIIEKPAASPSSRS